MRFSNNQEVQLAEKLLYFVPSAMLFSGFVSKKSLCVPASSSEVPPEGKVDVVVVIFGGDVMQLRGVRSGSVVVRWSFTFSVQVVLSERWSACRWKAGGTTGTRKQVARFVM